ncbi:MAG: hypothetical protein KKG06_01460, partial [Bacteroidetes bacterium]|nr:hypothetical protein [Bacteroidota bacterium]MBU1421846.1 hypothetical protein [Bacteroidota bacterium]
MRKGVKDPPDPIDHVPARLTGVSRSGGVRASPEKFGASRRAGEISSITRQVFFRCLVKNRLTDEITLADEVFEEDKSIT